MIADIPHSPDIICQDIGYSDSFPTTSKRNNNSKINLTNTKFRPFYLLSIEIWSKLMFGQNFVQVVKLVEPCP